VTLRSHRRRPTRLTGTSTVMNAMVDCISQTGRPGVPSTSQLLSGCKSILVFQQRSDVMNIMYRVTVKNLKVFEMSVLRKICDRATFYMQTKWAKTRPLTQIARPLLMG